MHSSTLAQCTHSRQRNVPDLWFYDAHAACAECQTTRDHTIQANIQEAQKYVACGEVRDTRRYGSEYGAEGHCGREKVRPLRGVTITQERQQDTCWHTTGV